MKPIKPPFDGPATTQDHAKDGFSLYALENLVRDCDGQPDWRPRADVAHAYYDFKQLSAERQHQIRRDMGIDPRQTNLIHGVINGVLGQEARARTDVTLQADDEETADVCDALSKTMKEAQRETCADMAVSNGYAGQVKGGVGWVEVSRASDPLDYPYRVEDRHRNEIYWDWRATDLGLKTARWQVRVRWEDLDEAEALMPEHREILRSCVNGWNLANLPDDLTSAVRIAYNNERRTTIHRDQWLDSTRRRIKFYEVWYRVPAEVVVMQVSPTRRIVFDENNPLHQLAVQRGRVRLERSVTRQVRMALFAGPHRLLDVGTKRRHFPYVPFFAFRDDEDRSPYGLIEGMISPQDEYNERRQMINWMLRARQIQMDSDALDKEYNTIADITETAGRPDMVAILNPQRRNANALKIGNDLTLQREQVDVMQDAKQLIQDVPRVYGTQLGNAPAGVTSGVAINSLTEQGAVAMGELNDNYRFARRMVFEQLLDLIIEDHLEEELKVAVGQGSNRRIITLNTYNPQTGEPVNRVKDAPVKVGLGDLPNTPAFRMQEQQTLGQIIQALAGDTQALAILTPAYIEGSTLANRTQMADDLRRMKGIPTAGDRQAQKQNEAAQAAALQQAQELQQRGAMAKVAKDEAQAAEATARAAQTETETQLMLGNATQPAVAIDPVADPLADEDALIAEALQAAERPEALPA
jgi:hypothetical protein